MRSMIRGMSAVAVGVAALLATTQAQAQATLYAADNTTAGVYGVVKFNNNLGVTGTFTTTGTIAGLATDGTSVFASLPSGVTQFTPAGATVRSYANVGADHFASLAYAGTTLFAADNTTAGVYGVVLFNSAVQVMSTFTTATAIAGLASDGASVYASLTTGITKYSLTGAILASYANVGADQFGALSFANNTLYAADNTTAGVYGVVELSQALAVKSTFLTTGTIGGLAADGTNVYASLPTGVAEYTNAGALVRTYANVGADSFGAVALTPSAAAAVPEPVTWAMMVVGFAAVGGTLRRRGRTGRALPIAA